jgi:hypothetical protein
LTQRGALEIRDGRVDFERLSKVTSTLISDIIVHKTAGEKGIWDMASVGANGVNTSQCMRWLAIGAANGALDDLQRLVGREHVSKTLGALSSETVIGDTANKCAAWRQGGS